MHIIKSQNFTDRQITLLVRPEIFFRGGGGRKKKGDEKESEKRYRDTYKLHGPSTTWYFISG